jgi:hypothetical protein
MPQDDDGQDGLAALSFASPRQPDSDGDSGGMRQALSFSDAAGADGRKDSMADALTAWTPAQSNAPDELAAIRPAGDVAGGEDVRAGLAKVINPPGTVAVTASIDGSVQQILLSPEVTRMTESELAGEILCIADLARQQGLAGQRSLIGDSLTVVAEMLKEEQQEDGDPREFINESLDLPTREQADAEQADVFASRYPAATD